MAQFNNNELCFCKTEEAVDPCPCTDQSIDKLNNEHIYDKLQKLLSKDFFRFYKVIMDKQCPFWPDERQCGTKQCGIAFCDDEVAAGLRRPAVATARVPRDQLHGSPSGNYSLQATASTPFRNSTASIVMDSTVQECKDDLSNAFDPMDPTLEEKQKK